MIKATIQRTEDGKKQSDSGKCMQIFNEKFHMKLLKNEEKYDIILLVLVIIPFPKERALDQNYGEKRLRKLTDRSSQ